MSEKEQQIDELASDIEKRLEQAKIVVGSMNKGIGYWIAEDLVNKNYRKITPNVDFVVKAGELSTIQMNALKQTAIEILDLIDKESNGQTVMITNIIRKKYGVEIEE